MSTTTVDPSTATPKEKFSKWTLPSNATSYRSLQLDHEATLDSLADDEVLVELYAASLNARDLMIAKGAAPGDIKANVVPGSDGAGIVRAIGKDILKFRVGDRVVTHLTPTIAEDEFPSMADVSVGLGQVMDGTLAEFGTFSESALVKAPRNLRFEEAGTLSCSGLTAWNALMGLKRVKAGDWVLAEGTGGVSIAVLQFAVALGAQVVATTSSSEKAKKLGALGAAHIVNYRETTDWGVQARRFTPGGRGFDMVVDIGGGSTLSESLKAVRRNGIVVAAGVLGGFEVQGESALSVLYHVCSIRGILSGSREQLDDLVGFIEEKGVVPAVDDEVFSLADASHAYAKVEAQKHFSKVVIRIKSEEGR